MSSPFVSTFFRNSLNQNKSCELQCITEISRVKNFDENVSHFLSGKQNFRINTALAFFNIYMKYILRDQRSETRPPRAKWRIFQAV